MQIDLLLKLIHIATAITWIGDASFIMILLLPLMRRDDEDARRILSYMSLIGIRFFMPMAPTTFLAGFAFVWLGSWGFAAWTLLAAATVAVTVTLGAAALSPVADRYLAVWRAGDPLTAMELHRRAVCLTKFDVAAQGTVISLTVLKPGQTEPRLLGHRSLILLGIKQALLRTPRAANMAYSGARR